jgi:hypothetical protein
MMASFYKHNDGRYGIAHTVADEMDFRHQGFAVTTSADYISEANRRIGDTHPIDTVIIDRDTAQNAAAGIAQLLDMLADQGATHAPVIEETLAHLQAALEPRS